MASPQTDAFLIEGGNYSYAGLADHARRLERERDAAREALLELYVVADTIRRAHWMHWDGEENYNLTAAINKARTAYDATDRAILEAKP